MGIPMLPHLTHLSFPLAGVVPDPLFAQVLEACVSLRVLVILVDLYVSDDLSQAFVMLLRDARVVVMYNHITREGMNDWHLGARGLGDYWQRAEEAITNGRRFMATPESRVQSEDSEDSEEDVFGTISE